MAKIRVAIFGAGGAAKAFMEGILRHSVNGKVDGLWHGKVGGYTPGEIEVAAAFEVDSSKIGLSLMKALGLSGSDRGMPRILRGVLADELPTALRMVVKADPTSVEDVLSNMKEASPDIALNLISSGLDATTRSYAQLSLDSGCSFVNATPTPVASDRALASMFAKKGLAVAGDDLMSQLGGTVFHRGILDLLDSRGVKVLRSYQVDVAGNRETINTLDERVRSIKREVKTSSIAHELSYHMENVAGTTDYVDYLGDERVSHYWMCGSGFLGSQIYLDMWLRTRDGPNAGNILLDVVRAVKASRDRGEKGALQTVSAYGFKSPPKPVKMRDSLEQFRRSFLED